MPARALPSLLAAALLLAAGAAVAQEPRGILLRGTARTGDDQREVRFVLDCTGNAPGATGTLSVELSVPGYEALQPRFDFLAYEGPDANAGRRTRIGPSEAAAAASAPLAVAGWIGVDADRPFAFGLAGALRRDDARLRQIRERLAPVLAQPGRLVWQQGNLAPRGPAIVATAEIGPAALEGLRARLAPCMGSPPPGGAARR